MEGQFGEQIEVIGGEELKNPNGIGKLATDVNEYNEVDRLIKEIKDKMQPLQKQLKELKQTKKLIEQDICQYMGDNNVEKCNLPEDSGTLKYSSRESPATITQQFIKDTIIKFFEKKVGIKLSENERGQCLINYIYKDERPHTKKQSLRKLKPK